TVMAVLLQSGDGAMAVLVRGQPLSAPWVMPPTICRPKTVKTRSRGRVPTSAPAVMTDQSVDQPVPRPARATWTVGLVAPFIAMIGHRKSFQDSAEARIPQTRLRG